MVKNSTNPLSITTFLNNSEAISSSGVLFNLETSSPTFYIPKTESYLEARLWDKIFTFSEKYLGLENGTIKATFLVETLPAAFQTA